MGILAEPLQYIRDLKLIKGFSVCELGDQWVTCAEPHYPASQFYQSIGCKRYVCIDGNGKASETYDLNKPLPPELGVFDLVTDFGTGEHVFNQLQIFKSIHHLTKVDGYMVFDRPCNGYQGHCFYLIQKNLISAIVHANWYEVIRLEERETTRGTLLRGVIKKRRDGSFVVPQQGRYFKHLVIDSKFTRRGAEYKNKELLEAGVVGKRSKS